MKIKYLALNLVAASSILLSGCMNLMGSNQENSNSMAASLYSINNPKQVVIYPTRADLPKNSKIIGTVTAQNHDSKKRKFKRSAVEAELKNQAYLLGANGIVHVTRGIAQTTADAVLVK